MKPFDSEMLGLDMEVRSIAIKGTGKANSTDIYLSSLLPIALDSVPNKYYQTPYDAFIESCNKFGDQPLLGYRLPLDIKTPSNEREYNWLTYSQTLTRVHLLGLGLRSLVPFDPIPSIALCLRARPEWVISDLACQAFNLISITLFSTYGRASLEHVLFISKSKLIILDSISIENILTILPNLPSLKVIISADKLIGDLGLKLRYKASKLGVKLIDWNEVLQLGSEQGGVVAKYLSCPTPKEEVCSIAYTSGTTNLPKGVSLTPSNLAAAMFSLHVSNVFRSNPIISFEYLPYAHVHHRIRVYWAIAQGYCLGYFTGSDKNLLDDIQELKPTVLSMSKQLLKSIKTIINLIINESGDKAKSLIKNIGKNPNEIINYSSDDEEELNNNNNKMREEDKEWLNNQVFYKIRNKLGNNLKLITGSNFPVPSHLVELLEMTLGVEIIQAYGSMETCGLGFRTSPNQRGGQVGGVVPLLQAKLIDTPELEYYAKDQPQPRGEIWLKGPLVSNSYFQQKTKLLTDDGWYPTGDIATLEVNTGIFSIIDRKANFFKLINGHYITPEKIESTYLKLDIISDLYIPNQPYLNNIIAIIVPNPIELVGWAGYFLQRPTTLSEYETLCKDPKVQKALVDHINQLISSFKILKKYELIKQAYLEPKPFDLKNGFVTPSKKLKRSNLRSHYVEVIDNLSKLVRAPTFPKL